MRLSKELRTVTKLSRITALVLFISLPFVGFYFGRIYQQSLDQSFSAMTISDTPQLSTKVSPVADLNTSNWKEFKDPSRKFMFNFPQNWLISFTESEIYKDKSDIRLEGPEGHIDVFWADSYGGACADPGYEKIELKSGEETICHAEHIQSDGKDNNDEFWQLQKQFRRDQPEGIYINAYSNHQNQEVILKIIQSFNITP